MLEKTPVKFKSKTKQSKPKPFPICQIVYMTSSAALHLFVAIQTDPPHSLSFVLQLSLQGQQAGKLPHAVTVSSARSCHHCFQRIHSFHYFTYWADVLPLRLGPQ